MPFDFKKEYKEYYLPPSKPGIVSVPSANYVAVRGSGNPNDETGEFKAAIDILYGISFTIKMSYKGNHRIDGYFEYVVPPLEGLWWSERGAVDYAHKEEFRFMAMIRLPEFVTEEVFLWAVEEASRKKGKDFSVAEFFSYDEGLCVQCMHLGPYDDEPSTIARMEEYVKAAGYRFATDDGRLHHEIYLSDPRRTSPEKLKTVLRYPIVKL